MHLQLSHDLLLKATDLIARVADKNNPRFPILSNIKFELTPEALTLVASDLEVELTTTVKLDEGACVQAGSMTLPANKFHEICKSLNKNDKVSIELLDDGRCLIKSGKSRFTLVTLSADDFPSIGVPADNTFINIARTALHEMISQTRFCMANQDVRHYLTGMLFHIDQGFLTTVATDGHRLAVAKRVLADIYDEMQVIVPGKAVIELERLFGELGKSLKGDDDVSLGLDGEFLQVKLNFGKPDENNLASDELTVTMTARLIEGKFPDYKRVLPTNCNKATQFPKDAMLDVLRRVSILSNERSRGVIFEFADNVATVRSGGGDNGEAVDSLSVQYEGDPIELSLNESYLKAVFGVLTGDIKIAMSQPNSPTLITQVGDDLRQYVVMPMRI